MSRNIFVVHEEMQQAEIARLLGLIEMHGREIERLRAERNDAHRLIWLMVWSNGGYTIERHDLESFPGDRRAIVEQRTDAATGDMILSARFDNEQAAPKKDDPPDGWMSDGSWAPGG